MAITLAMKDRMRRVVESGFDYVQFGDHHYRFEGYVDFWPSTERFYILRDGAKGRGTDDLISRLRRRFPELATEPPAPRTKAQKRAERRRGKATKVTPPTTPAETAIPRRPGSSS